MRKIGIIAMTLLAASSIALVGCAGGVAGSAVAVSAPTTVLITSTVATPTVTATVQPTMPAPVTVAQAPSTVTPTSGTTADDQIAGDHSIADSTISYWIPQLGSYTDSPSAMHRFDDVQASYPDAIMVWSGDYSSC